MRFYYYYTHKNMNVKKIQIRTISDLYGKQKCMPPTNNFRTCNIVDGIDSQSKYCRYFLLAVLPVKYR